MLEHFPCIGKVHLSGLTRVILFSFRLPKQFLNSLRVVNTNYMSLFNSNTVTFFRLLIAYLTSHLRFIFARSTARIQPCWNSRCRLGFVYLYIGITLSDYRLSQILQLCNLEGCIKNTFVVRAKYRNPLDGWKKS